MKRKNIFIISTLAASLILSGVVGWNLYQRGSNKPQARMATVEVPAATRLLDIVKVGGDFDVNSDDFKDPSLKTDDIVSLTFEACKAKKMDAAKAIFNQHLGSCKNQDTLNLFADLVVKKTDASNVEAFNCAAAMLENDEQYTILLKSAVAQGNKIVFDALLSGHKEHISNQPIIFDESSNRKITIFDFAAGQNARIRAQFMTTLLENFQAKFEENNRFAVAVAKDGPHYVDLILKQGQCEAEELARLFVAVKHNATICSGKDYVNLLNAVKKFVSAELIKKTVVIDRETLNDLGPEKKELVDELTKLTQFDKSILLAPFKAAGNMIKGAANFGGKALLVTGGAATLGATMVGGVYFLQNGMNPNSISINLPGGNWEMPDLGKYFK